MTSKGQVTIPKRMRDALGLQPGSEIEFVPNGSGDIVIRTKTEPDLSRFEPLIGTLKLGMTTDEFMLFLRGDPDADPGFRPGALDDDPG
jgi:AbrB family looped-hinge helix DNA binding protein